MDDEITVLMLIVVAIRSSSTTLSCKSPRTFIRSIGRRTIVTKTSVSLDSMRGHSPEGFQVLTTHACYRPVKQVTLLEAVDLVSLAIRFARENKIKTLLADITELTGFESPTTTERYLFGERFAVEAMGMVKVAMVARPEVIHPRRFGVLVARNRGLLSEVFNSEADAIAWLLDAREVGPGAGAVLTAAIRISF